MSGFGQNTAGSSAFSFPALNQANTTQQGAAPTFSFGAPKTAAPTVPLGAAPAFGATPTLGVSPNLSMNPAATTSVSAIPTMPTLGTTQQSGTLFGQAWSGGMFSGGNNPVAASTAPTMPTLGAPANLAPAAVTSTPKTGQFAFGTISPALMATPQGQKLMGTTTGAVTSSTPGYSIPNPQLAPPTMAQPPVAASTAPTLNFSFGGTTNTTTAPTSAGSLGLTVPNFGVAPVSKPQATVAATSFTAPASLRPGTLTFSMTTTTSTAPVSSTALPTAAKTTVSMSMPLFTGPSPSAPPTITTAVPASVPSLAQPSLAQSSLAQPSLGQPSLAQSSLAQPTLAQPSLAQQTLAQPSLAQPSLGQPSLGQPSLGQPSLGQPSLGQPLLAQPSLAQPSLAQPSLAQPSLGQPSLAQQVATTTNTAVQPTTTSISGSTVATTTAIAIPAAAVSDEDLMTYSKLQENINKWAMELEKQEKIFLHQATEMNGWDRVIVENSDKLHMLNSKIEKVRKEQKHLDLELDYILSQQNELDYMLKGLEKDWGSVPPSDPERQHTYKIAESLDYKLKLMSEDLKEVVDHMNAMNYPPNDEFNPVMQIVRILNAHMNVLLMVERKTNLAETKVKEVGKLLELCKRDYDRACHLYFD